MPHDPQPEVAALQVFLITGRVWVFGDKVAVR
jgi:hypothetical protein